MDLTNTEFLCIYGALFVILCIILWIIAHRLWNYAAKRVAEDQRRIQENEEQICCSCFLLDIGLHSGGELSDVLIISTKLIL